jgi:hypothetical protein
MAKNRDIIINGNIEAHQHYSFETKEYYYSNKDLGAVAYSSKTDLCKALGVEYKSDNVSKNNRTIPIGLSNKKRWSK